MSIQVKQGEELVMIPTFLEKLNELAGKAGGEPPLPENPDTSFLEDVRLTSGNEQLLAVYNRREELQKAINDWTSLAKGISERQPSWIKLQRLSLHVKNVPDSDVILSQVDHIEQNRQLLDKTDLVTPLISSLTQMLREELNRLQSLFDKHWKEGGEKLDADENWQQLDSSQRHDLRLDQQLVEALKPVVNVESADEILLTLDNLSLSAFSDRVIAMPSKFDRIILEAAKLMEPDIQQVSIPSQTLKTEEDVDIWLKDVRKILIENLVKI